MLDKFKARVDGLRYLALHLGDGGGVVGRR